MMPITNNFERGLENQLQQRREQNLIRQLQVNEGLIDFCSNDYLSFARSAKLKQLVSASFTQSHAGMGATGSRSISGNTAFAEKLEAAIAHFHHAEAALLFNSGYDANLGFFSCIAGKNDTIITDELIHASIIDGCRLSHATRFRFQHNNITDLEKKLSHAHGNIIVAVESVYSMDGDEAPLEEIVALCEKYHALLVVDEAHATGVFGQQGRGLVNEKRLEKKVWARIHTFGKAMGCHGAAIVGSHLLREYLINFARSFIFTTALPQHSLMAIEAAYRALQENDFNHNLLHQHIQYFSTHFPRLPEVTLIPSRSPIQSVLIPGNARSRQVAQQLQAKGFDVRAILSPSVPAGKERLRISLHQHNSASEIEDLLNTLKHILQA